MRQRGRKNLGAVIILSTLLIGSLALAQVSAGQSALLHLPYASASSSNHSSAGIIQPLYIYPIGGGATWQPAISAHQLYPAVPYEAVIDPPTSGHFSSADPLYVNATQDISKHGITVLGYVYTKDCGRNITQIEQDINNYMEYYQKDGVSGIFFDQMGTPSDSCFSGLTPANYYSTLTKQALDDGFQFTIGNPGVDVNSSFINTVRTLNIFENGYLPSNQTLAGSNYSSECQTQGSNGWHLCFDKSNFSFTAHSISSSSFPSSETIQGWSNYVGFMYFANDSYYAVFPPYLDQELADLNIPSTDVTVAMDNSSLEPIQGGSVVIYQPTASCTLYAYTCGEIRQGTSPLTLNASSGWQYELSVSSSFGTCTFSKWLDSGSTNPNRSITAPSSSETLTAVYTGGSCGSATSSAITVDSINQTGGALSGYYTTLSQNGKVERDGFTPITFSNLNAGQNYTIDPEDYTCTFNHWNDTGSTVRLRNVTAASGDQIFTAVYDCPSVSSVTVQSVDQNGNKITGYHTVLYNGTGSIVNTGFTPVTFSDLSYKAKYVVRPEDYGTCSFAYWKDTQNTTRYRSFVANGVDQTFTAAYNCYSSPSVTLQTINQTGGKITGYYVGLYNSGGTLINHGSSWITFSGLSVGTSYFVEPDNYGSCTFNHWQDTGSTTRDRSFTAASTQTFTAVYDCT